MEARDIGGGEPRTPDRSAALRRPGRRLKLIAAGGVLVLVAAGLAVWIVHPVQGSGGTGGVTDNSYPTSRATIADRSLSSQTEVSGTLGYAGSYSVVNQARGTITALPSIGQTVSQGQSFYSLDGAPAVLLYGKTPMYRSLSVGKNGTDVQQLNADLVALGDATRSELDPSSSSFTAVTASAVAKLQTGIGEASTGSLALGEAVFLPSALRISNVNATLGAPAQPGVTLLQGTSTTREVVVNLDTTLQADVKVGDQVTITLPDSRTTAGVVSAVGTVATTPSGAGSSAAGNAQSSGGSSGGTPTIEVDVTPSDPTATGSLDQAPVEVTITTDSVKNALVVPVDALVALANGGYAVEVAGSHGVHHLMPVSLGLFDDADGLVQVTGSGLSAGQQVVVPTL